eukprot:6513949-Prymnesium_polylepis.1
MITKLLTDKAWVTWEETHENVAHSRRRARSPVRTLDRIKAAIKESKKGPLVEELDSEFEDHDEVLPGKRRKIEEPDPQSEDHDEKLSGARPAIMFDLNDSDSELQRTEYNASSENLSRLSIDAFSEVSLGDAEVPYIDGLYSDEKVFRFLKYLEIASGGRAGLSNAAGVAFDEDLLLRMAAKPRITLPLVVAGKFDPVLTELYLDQPGTSTTKSAVRLRIVTERLKLLLERLEGTTSLPHSAQPLDLLKEKLRCAAGSVQPVTLHQAVYILVEAANPLALHFNLHDNSLLKQILERERRNCG